MGISRYLGCAERCDLERRARHPAFSKKLTMWRSSTFPFRATYIGYIVAVLELQEAISCFAADDRQRE